MTFEKQLEQALAAKRKAEAEEKKARGEAEQVRAELRQALELIQEIRRPKSFIMKPAYDSAGRMCSFTATESTT